MDCHFITRSLCIGVNPQDQSDLKELQSMGITGILSLQSEEDLRDRDPDWEKSVAERPSVPECSHNRLRLAGPQVETTFLCEGTPRTDLRRAPRISSLHRRDLALAYGWRRLPSLVRKLASK